MESRSRRRWSVSQLATDLRNQEVISFLLEHRAEEVTSYAVRVMKMVLEKFNSREGQQKKRKRFRRHMRLATCLSSIQQPAAESH